MRENFRPKEEGAGNAGRALHPRSRVQSAQRKTHTSIQVQRRRPRHSPRNGFTPYGALSPATNSSCHRYRRISDLPGPVGPAKISTDLTPATGARTTRFCRTQPPVFAERGFVGLWRRSSCARDIAHGTNRPAISTHTDAAASTASRPNVRDDGQRPSLKDETARRIVLICPSRLSKNSAFSGVNVRFGS